MPYLMGAPFGGYRDTAGSLDGLGWRLAASMVDPSDSAVWLCAASSSNSSIMGGVPGTSYDVELQFVGVFETKKYDGGTNDGAYWQVGGTPHGPPPDSEQGPNIYKLEISNPPQTFYINRGAGGSTVQAVDYTKTIEIAAGATVTLSADAVAELAPHAGEFRELKHTISVPGVTDPAQPYFGQFANMIVVSIAPH